MSLLWTIDSGGGYRLTIKRRGGYRLTIKRGGGYRLTIKRRCQRRDLEP
jgi:hypothetical protein